MNDTFSKIKRLDFENIINLIFIIVSIINIYGNENQKKYLINDNVKYEKDANNLYVVGLILVFLIYIYFFNRNFTMYKNKDNPTEKDLIKVIGSFLFVVGAICLLYFQINNKDNFILGEPV